MERLLKHDYKLFSGIVMSDLQVDTYNALTSQINRYHAAGITPPESLLNGRHNMLQAVATRGGQA